jgi:hypothetical protein
MTHRDWGTLGRMLRDQYKYVRSFISDIMSDKLSEAQINAYAKMHSSAAIAAYNKAKAKIVSKMDYDEVAWINAPGFIHCQTCEDRAKLGYIPIGPKGGFMFDGKECFPGDGTSECFSNCKCQLSYRNSKTLEEYIL